MISFFLVGVDGLLKKVHFVKRDTTVSSSVPDLDYFNRPGPWDEKDLKSLLSANKVWAKKMATERPGFFDEIKRGHAPKILWIGCSDARVPANEMIGEPPGSVFVHRNVANMVTNTDFNCLSVVQYAVEVLKVKHIIVCGHYDCGGIRAALEPVVREYVGQRVSCVVPLSCCLRVKVNNLESCLKKTNVNRDIIER